MLVQFGPYKNEDFEDLPKEALQRFIDQVAPGSPLADQQIAEAKRVLELKKERERI